MKNNRRNHRAGFTLAELLMTIAILAVLFGIGFVNVIRYQRQLKLTENNDIAREIFTAAQNRMTSDKANGIWDEDKATVTGKMTKPANFGENTPVLDTSKNTLSWPDPNEEYVYALYDAGSLNDVPSFLPLGSIDESVRTDGHYIIEYNRRTAAVYGVWYSDTGISYDDVRALDETRSNDSTAKARRLEYKNSTDNKRRIIGYYGNAVAADINPVEASIEPTLDIHNDDVLFASISFKPDSEKKYEVSDIRLTLDGLKSKATVTKEIYSVSATSKGDTSYDSDLVVTKETDGHVVNNVILDDITSSKGHFSQIFSTYGFIPGEDIKVTATFVVNGKEIKRSAVTNSLFAQIAEKSTDHYTADIANTRHLQNLSSTVSGLTSIAHNGDGKNGIFFTLDKAEVINSIAFRADKGSTQSFLKNIKSIRNDYLKSDADIYGDGSVSISVAEGSWESAESFMRLLMHIFLALRETAIFCQDLISSRRNMTP